MLVYVQALIQIALRKLGPEDLPDSSFLLGLSFAAYIACQVPLAWIAYGPGTVAFSMIGLSAVLLIVFLWALLQLTGNKARFRQTLTALVGTGALLSLISLPFSLWRAALLDTDAASALPSLAIFAIMLWSLAIDGHILARALSRPFIVGLLVSIAYFLVQTTVLFELLPVSEAG